MTDNDILELIGIKFVEYHKKYKEFKSIEELAKDMLNPQSTLYFMHKSQCIHNCFPSTHIIAEGDIEFAKKAFEGKGLFKYAELLASSEDNINTVPGETTVKTPFYTEMNSEKDVTSLIALNDADTGGSCPHANSCPYLKTMRETIVGRPCPFVIKLMIQNMVFFTDVFLKDKRDLTGNDNVTLENLSFSERISIVNNASKKTKSDFMMTFESTKSLVTWTKDGFQTTIVNNDSNNQSNSINKTINENLIKHHGIDEVAKSKIQLKQVAEIKKEEASKKDSKNSSSLYLKPPSLLSKKENEDENE